MVTVFGIDPSTKRIGLARPDGSTTSITAHAGADDPYRRLHELKVAVVRELRCWPDAALAVVEGYTYAVAGRKALVRLGEIGGAIRLAVFEAGLDLVDITPTALKLAATGNGAAKKPEMVAHAQALGATPRNDDEADAWHLHNVGRRALAGDLTLPPSVAALPWPTPTGRNRP